MPPRTQCGGFSTRIQTFLQPTTHHDMPKLTIDNREVEVPPGATVLDAARKLGIDIPTLCQKDGLKPATSCLACMVKLVGPGKLVPSCGTVAAEGMQVESETEEVHHVRRSALELLLSDHLGDCLTPCYFGCPANMDIPQMLRQIAAGDFAAAIRTVKQDIALPAVLGRICPAPCEKACRRRAADGAVAICKLKRFVADVDLACEEPFHPACKPATGKRVAIIGAGPAGLAAAYYLAQEGHACTLFDRNDRPGGRLRTEITGEELPRDVLDAEVDTILRLGIEVHANTAIAEGPAELRNESDAVLIACGATVKEQAESWNIETVKRGIAVKQGTFETNVGGVFAAGNAIRGKGLVIRSAADGKEVAVAIGQYLQGQAVTGPQRPFNTRIGSMDAAEFAPLLAEAGKAARLDPPGGFDPKDAVEQAARCLHCDCRKLRTCKLRKYAAEYGADPRRYPAQRRRFELQTDHPQILYEPGKCISCGLCVQIAERAGEPLGLTFIGRGFNVRIGVPLGGRLDSALQKAAAECVGSCPTAALAWKAEEGP